jgi:hypothetical protein
VGGEGQNHPDLQHPITNSSQPNTNSGNNPQATTYTVKTGKYTTKYLVLVGPTPNTAQQKTIPKANNNEPKNTPTELNTIIATSNLLETVAPQNKGNWFNLQHNQS